MLGAARQPAERLRFADLKSSPPLLLAGIVLAHGLIAAIVGRRVLAGNGSFVTEGDAFDQSVMWLYKVFFAANQGQLVLWDFTTQSGVSFIGEQQTAPLYPLALAFGWFGLGVFPDGYDQFLMAHYVIGAVGMTVLLRGFGLGLAAALCGSMIFAYTGSFPDRVLGQPNLFCSLAYMPWIAHGLARLAGGTDRRTQLAGFAIAALATALSILAGHLHAVAIGMVAAVVLAAAHARADSRTALTALVRAGGWGAVVLAFALLLSAPQIVATQEYLRLAWKWSSQGPTRYPHVASAAEFALYSLRAADFASLFGRHADIRDGGTLFVTYTGLAALATLPLTLRQQSPQQRTVIAGALLLLAMSLVFAAGWIYPWLPMLNLVRSPTRWLFASGLALSILAAFAIAGAASLAERRVGRRRLVALLPAAALVLILVECTLHFGGRIVRPPWAENSASAALRTPVVKALLAEMDRHPHIFRYHAPRELVPPNLGNLYFALGSHGHRATRTVAYHGYFDFDPRGEPVRSFGIRWWVAQGDVPGLEPVWREGDIAIYERSDALPVLWTLGVDGSKSGVAIEDVDWRPNSVTFRLKQPVSGRVVFGQAYFPGFRAMTEGGPYAVEPFESLSAVNLIRPTQAITFEYAPSWWGWSMAAAAAAWIALMAMLVWTGGGSGRPSPGG
jgi:hypothetical protein